MRQLPGNRSSTKGNHEEKRCLVIFEWKVEGFTRNVGKKTSKLEETAEEHLSVAHYFDCRCVRNTNIKEPIEQLELKNTCQTILTGTELVLKSVEVVE